MIAPSLKRLGTGCLAALLSLSLHVLLLVPLVSGPLRGFTAHATATPRNSRPPDSMEAWVLTDDSNTSKADVRSSLAAISEEALARTQTRSKDVLSATEDAHFKVEGLEETVVVDMSDTEQTSENAAPPYVRYMGEVTARIQRRWALPTAKSNADFHCRALIRRGPAGEAEVLTLQPCDEDPALQASVLKAIRSATPLPLRSDPPDETLALDFVVFGGKAEGRSSSVQPGAADSRL